MVYYYKRHMAALAKRIRKVLVCEHCGQAFSFDTTVFGYAETHNPWGFFSNMATTLARKRAISDFEANLLQQSDLVPCPRCRKYDHAMETLYRRKYGASALDLVAVTSLVGLVWIIVGGQSYSTDTGTNWATAFLVPILCGLFLLWFLYNYIRTCIAGIESIPENDRDRHLQAHSVTPIATESLPAASERLGRFAAVLLLPDAPHPEAPPQTSTPLHKSIHAWKALNYSDRWERKELKKWIGRVDRLVDSERISCLGKNLGNDMLAAFRERERPEDFVSRLGIGRG